MTDYEMNNKPVVKVPATLKPIKQTNQNLSPLTNPAPSKSAYPKNIMPDNGVTNASSAKLQKAGRLPGRLGKGGANKVL